MELLMAKDKKLLQMGLCDRECGKVEGQKRNEHERINPASLHCRLVYFITPLNLPF
jgi:hypothetical protein